MEERALSRPINCLRDIWDYTEIISSIGWSSELNVGCWVLNVGRFPRYAISHHCRRSHRYHRL